MEITKGGTVRVTFTEGGGSASYVYKVLAVAETFIIVEEGPGLSATIRRNLAAANPTWRFDGYAVTVEPIYEEPA